MAVAWPKLARSPRILAHAEPQASFRQVGDFADRAWLEMSRFVEDVVGRQELLRCSQDFSSAAGNDGIIGEAPLVHPERPKHEC